MVTSGTCAWTCLSFICQLGEGEVGFYNRQANQVGARIYWSFSCFT